MHKLTKKLKNLYKTRAVHTLLLVLVGALLGSLLTLTISDSPSSGRSDRSSVIKDRTQQSKERQAEELEENYQDAKDRVARELEAKQIDQEKADLIYKKLEEMYQFLKGKDRTKSDDRTIIAEKQAEWRKWAQENDVSTRYIVMMRL